MIRHTLFNFIIFIYLTVLSFFSDVIAAERPYILPDMTDTIDRLEQSESELHGIIRTLRSQQVNRDPVKIINALGQFDKQVSKIEVHAKNIYNARKVLIRVIDEASVLVEHDFLYILAWQPNLQGNLTMLQVVREDLDINNNLRLKVTEAIVVELLNEMPHREKIAQRASYVKQHLQSTLSRLNQIKVYLLEYIYNLRAQLAVMRPILK